MNTTESARIQPTGTRYVRVGDHLRYKSHTGEVHNFRVTLITSHNVCLECDIPKLYYTYKATESIMIRNGYAVLPVNTSGFYTLVDDLLNTKFIKE